MANQHYLVRGHIGWADEIEFNGYVIVDAATLEVETASLERAIEINSDYEQTQYIGTNEEVEITPSEVLNELRGAKPIPEEVYKWLKENNLASIGRTCYSEFDVKKALNDISEDE